MSSSTLKELHSSALIFTHVFLVEEFEISRCMYITPHQARQVWTSREIKVKVAELALASSIAILKVIEHMLSNKISEEELLELKDEVRQLHGNGYLLENLHIQRPPRLTEEMDQMMHIGEVLSSKTDSLVKRWMEALKRAEKVLNEMENDQRMKEKTHGNGSVP